MKFSALAAQTSEIDLAETKPIEVSIAQFRILLNDIQLISYDIEQLKQSDFEDKHSIASINDQWEDLLAKANAKYHWLEKTCEQLKRQQKLVNQIHQQLDSIEKQVQESTLHTKFPILIERVAQIDEQIEKELNDGDGNKQIAALKRNYTHIGREGGVKSCLISI